MNILKVNKLTKMYDEHSGILDFDMTVDSEDIVLLLGPNGAGKTTAFQSILGLTSCENQGIKIMDNPLDETREQIKDVGAMVSKPSFYEYLTGFEYLKMFTLIFKNVDVKQVDKILNEVGLSKAKDKLIRNYSSGMKQRLDLARAILHKPSLLLLDEPFNGMDIEGKYHMKTLLNDMQAKADLGIVISSHMVGDLESFANKVIIIYEGRTLFSGQMASVRDSGLTLEEFYLEKLSLYKNKEA